MASWVTSMRTAGPTSCVRIARPRSRSAGRSPPEHERTTATGIAPASDSASAAPIDPAGSGDESRFAPPPASRELVGERLAEILAPGALRRALREVLVAEGPAESALVDAAPRRAASGLIESVAVALRDEIAQDVRGAGVERDHAVGLSFGDER